MIINHFQVIAISGNVVKNTPITLGDFFRGHSSVTFSNPNFSFIACELARTFIDVFHLVLITPLLLFAAMLMVAFVKTLRDWQHLSFTHHVEGDVDNELGRSGLDEYREEVLGENVPELHDEITVVLDDLMVPHEPAQQQLPEKDSITAAGPSINEQHLSWGNNFLRTSGVVVVVVLFIIHPNVIETSTTMLDCESIEFTQDDVRSVTLLLDHDNPDEGTQLLSSCASCINVVAEEHIPLFFRQ